MRILKTFLEVLAIILMLPFLIVMTVVAMVVYLAVDVFDRIAEHFANMTFCPYQPDDPLSPMCDKRVIGTDECKQCRWHREDG